MKQTLISQDLDFQKSRCRLKGRQSTPSPRIDEITLLETHIFRNTFILLAGSSKQFQSWFFSLNSFLDLVCSKQFLVQKQETSDPFLSMEFLLKFQSLGTFRCIPWAGNFKIKLCTYKEQYKFSISFIFNAFSGTLKPKSRYFRDRVEQAGPVGKACFFG